VLVVSEKICIPLRELHFSFVRSGGPGGQNVNKVNTKAVLRWSVADSPSIPAGVRERFCERYRRRITRTGEIVISSQRFRDQGRNVADCLSRLRELLVDAATAPPTRKATRPTAGSQARRRRWKEQHARKKQLRRDLPND
jgi:ribosome-associated protein